MLGPWREVINIKESLRPIAVNRWQPFCVGWKCQAAREATTDRIIWLQGVRCIARAKSLHRDGDKKNGESQRIDFPRPVK